MTDVSIGQAVKRAEDERFLTGQGNYIDDINLDGQARAAVLRSPHAHARINGIDASAAEAMDGVLLVITGRQWVAEGMGILPTKTGVRKGRNDTDINEPPRHCMAIDTARYIGEPVAFVVAETQEAANKALEMIDVDYESLAQDHPSSPRWLDAASMNLPKHGGRVSQMSMPASRAR